MYSVEWQKRGLPHLHLLIWLDDYLSTDQLDDLISAEIPDESDPDLLRIVKSTMIHGPCNADQNAPCKRDGSCRFKYPHRFVDATTADQNGYPLYRRRSPQSGGNSYVSKNITIDNRWVVPYSPVLSLAMNSHVNVECCNHIMAIKYVCKYINKGTDQATAEILNKDEIAVYQSGRYLSSSEAVWRILGFDIHRHNPPVQSLDVHLENGQRIYFNENNLLEQLANPSNTTLLAFFKLCREDEFARTILYSDVPSFFKLTAGKIFKKKILPGR